MIIRKFLFLLAILLTAVPSVADTLQFATENGAIDGFDPVSYFSDARPERGDPGITANWNGVDWHFTSEQHRDAFVANPEKYAPQYGGLDNLGRKALPEHDQRGVNHLALQPGQADCQGGQAMAGNECSGRLIRCDRKTKC
jgi:hypothetical protein